MTVYDQKIRFVLRGPWMKSRASFSIMRDVINADGTRTQTTVEDERIQALNRDYQASGTDLHQATLVLQEIKKDFEKNLKILRGDQPLSIENQEVLDEFIRKKIDIRTANKPGSRASDRNYDIRAITLLGNHSLRAVSNPSQTLKRIGGTEQPTCFELATPFT